MKPAVVQPEQPRIHSSTDVSRNFDPATGQGQGQSDPLPTRLPGSTSATKLDVLSPPHQREVSTTPLQQQEEPPTVIKSSPQASSRKSSTRGTPHERSKGGGEEVTPYDIESPPVLTLPPQSMVEEDRCPTHKITPPVDSGTPNESLSRPLPRPRASGKFQFSLVGQN